jgi:hypothetical protein
VSAVWHKSADVVVEAVNLDLDPDRMKGLVDLIPCTMHGALNTSNTTCTHAQSIIHLNTIVYNQN